MTNGSSRTGIGLPQSSQFAVSVRNIVTPYFGIFAANKSASAPAIEDMTGCVQMKRRMSE
ncbi:hypothetical protein PRZ48_005327 [Zasmidium cellare]|uniref:Uncharacterized protein n=1 Tax=Zasmidium cellare TaxID=395010 RepID=A0ABR0ETI8_ZASCE|nr:hypothetical protein PRZ48_005327 [Zasmidium cellare]